MLKYAFDKQFQGAIYLRLSKEDGSASAYGEKAESNSISNQRMLIRDFLKNHPEITVVREYCDDGFTGANFERPEFQKMMDAVRNREIDCIVVKDLSRFGREYIDSVTTCKKFFRLWVFALLPSTITTTMLSRGRLKTIWFFHSKI